MAALQEWNPNFILVFLLDLINQFVHLGSWLNSCLWHQRFMVWIRNYDERKKEIEVQWIRLRLPSYSPGIESQAQHLISIWKFELQYKKDEYKQKEDGIGPYLKKKEIQPIYEWWPIKWGMTLTYRLSDWLVPTHMCSTLMLSI